MSVNKKADLPSDWYSLLGETESSEKMHFLKSLESPRRLDFKNKDGSVESYSNYKSLGFSLLWKNKKLDAVFFYRNGVDGYKEYEGKLPYELEIGMNNAKVVQMLGEPSKKAVKNNVIPIWIEYPEKGLQVVFTYKSYDDKDNPISNISIFPPAEPTNTTPQS